MVGPWNAFVKGFRGPVAYLEEDDGFTGDGPAGGKRPFSAGRYRLPRVGAGDRMFPREPFMRRGMNGLKGGLGVVREFVTRGLRGRHFILGGSCYGLVLLCCNGIPGCGPLLGCRSFLSILGVTSCFFPPVSSDHPPLRTRQVRWRSAA